MKSTALTAGLGNVVVSTLELIGSVVTSLLALAVPVLTVILLLILLSIVFWVSGRVLFGRHKVST